MPTVRRPTPRPSERSAWIGPAVPCTSPWADRLPTVPTTSTSPATRRTPWTRPPANNPFGVAEFERILRCYDRDAGHAAAAAVQPDQQRQRLPLAVAAGGVHDGQLRGSCRPACCRPPCGLLNLARPMQSVMHPVDILAAKLPANVQNSSTLNQLRMQLLPWEILQGLKMDLNRPFGRARSP